MKTSLFLPFFLMVSLAFPALSETAELHAVGVYEGNIRTNGRIHGAEVRVLVDRTEAPVILSVGSYEPVRWFITTTPGTRIETVYLSGYQPERSEIYLNEVRLSATVLENLGSSYENKGERFREMVDRLTEVSNLSFLSSFHGSYTAPEEPFVINAVVEAPENRRDPLATAVRPDAVPSALRPHLDPNRPSQGIQASFDYDGFTLKSPDGTVQAFQVTLDVPEPSWPSGATLDEEGGRIFGVTHGGEGFLYQYDMTAEKWSVLSSMEHRDATGLVHDQRQNRLILGLGRHDLGVSIYDLETGQFRDVPLTEKAFPGMTDLYDVGNGPRPRLEPIAVLDNQVLLRATDDKYRRRDENQPISSRHYLVDLDTATVTLVAYQDAKDQTPRQ